VSAGATVLAAVMGSCDAGLRSVPLVGSYADGRLKSRPHEPSVDPPEPGRRAVRIEGAHALLSVPERQSAGRPLALALLLHGGSGHPGGGLRIWSPFRDDADIVMLAPQSNEGGAWDVMVADFGPDVAMIDGMLSWVFDRFRIDPLQLAVAGFSNGATYSLSLGLTNGDLFSHVVAISPGGMLPDGFHGRPPVFIAHGTQDRTLPIDETSRRIVPQLHSLGYPLRYVEFQGGHRLETSITRRAFDWWLGPPAP
jgi:predicted esterase